MIGACQTKTASAADRAPTGVRRANSRHCRARSRYFALMSGKRMRPPSIELTVSADNTRAINLYERFGFVREGRHQDFAMRDGAYVDALAMARMKGV